MIQAKLIGGMGNNMFQYAIARIVADTKNYNLAIDNIHQLQQYFINAVTVTERISNTNNILHVGYKSQNQLIQSVDLPSVLNHDGGVSFEGFFQKHYLYTKHKTDILNWFYYDDNNHFKPDVDDLVMHVRLGDYCNIQWNLHPSAYIKIVADNQIKYKNCYIVTDEPCNASLNIILNELPNTYILNQSILKDFTVLRHAEQLIISQSSFSWWSTFLGKQKIIYAPVNKELHKLPWPAYPKDDDIDLISDDPRYNKIVV